MGYISLVTDMASEEIAEIIKKSIDNLVKKDDLHNGDKTQKEPHHNGV